MTSTVPARNPLRPLIAPIATNTAIPVTVVEELQRVANGIDAVANMRATLDKHPADTGFDTATIRWVLDQVDRLINTQPPRENV